MDGSDTRILRVAGKFSLLIYLTKPYQLEVTERGMRCDSLNMNDKLRRVKRGQSEHILRRYGGL